MLLCGTGVVNLPFILYFKLLSSTVRGILRTFKTSLVPIDHEAHSLSHDFLYISCKTNDNE